MALADAHRIDDLLAGAATGIRGAEHFPVLALEGEHIVVIAVTRQRVAVFDQAFCRYAFRYDRIDAGIGRIRNAVAIIVDVTGIADTVRVEVLLAGIRYDRAIVAAVSVV